METVVAAAAGEVASSPGVFVVVVALLFGIPVGKMTQLTGVEVEPLFEVPPVGSVGSEIGVVFALVHGLYSRSHVLVEDAGTFVGMAQAAIH